MKQSSRLSLLLALGFLALPVSYSLAQTQDKPGEAPKAAAPLPPLAGPQACEDLYQKIRKFFDAFPTDFTGVKDEAADKLAEDAKGYAPQCEQLEKECSSLDKVKVAEVKLIHGKLTYVLSERFRRELLEKLRMAAVPNITEESLAAMKVYLGTVKRLAQEAYDALPETHAFRPRALQLVGQAANDSQDYLDAQKVYEKFVKDYPKDPETDRVLLALGRSLLDLEQYDKGIEVIEKARKECPKSDLYPYFVELLWKLYHGKGDVKGLEECVKTVETVYPLKLTNPQISKRQKDLYDLFLGFNGFRKGYVRFAQCDFVGARDAFMAHISQRNPTPDSNPAVGVYVGRSRDNLAFLDKLAGLPAPMELNLEWATDRRFRLSEVKGKVVAIVFRGVGDSRSADFLGPMWRYCSSHPDLEMVTISYLHERENVIARTHQLQDDLAKAGYDGPAGFDPDAAEKKLFRAYLANVGSATFEIVNRRGEVVWFMQDPREIDVQFVIKILEGCGQK